MLLRLLVLFFLTASPSPAQNQDESGEASAFHSIATYRAVDPGSVIHIPQENVDDLFDTRDIAKRLATEKRVRLFRRPAELDDTFFYHSFEEKAPLKDQLGTQLPTVEIAEADFRPMLALAADFSNYGDSTLCDFEPGVAILLGNDEPDYILICCFKCHDILIIRRPTARRPMPQVAEVSMSPELETALFALTRAAYPQDKALQSFKLAKRTRSKTPPVMPTFTPGDSSDPFATSKPVEPSK